MNRSEKESLLKNFFIFFFLMEILILIIFIFYYSDKKKDIENLLLKKMQVCSYTLSCKEFMYDFFPKKESIIPNKLYRNDKEVYALFPIATSKKYYLKVIYSKEALQKDKKELLQNLSFLFILVTILILSLAFGLTLYSLKPIRDALKINQEFIKDILHDFNTPISSILINLELMKRDCKSPYLNRVEQSVTTIISLQDNLKLFLKNIKTESQKIDLYQLIKERVIYFQSIYPSLHFKIDPHSKPTITSQKDLLIRIIDNLLSNACKYNKKEGFVLVEIYQNRLVIKDSGKGIKNSKKVFDRFYKESDRGIGIGLSIVKKLCEELDIKIELESTIGKGTTVTLRLPE